MGFLSTLNKLLDTAEKAQKVENKAQEQQAEREIDHLALPGEAPWKELEALVIVESGEMHEFEFPDEVDNPNQPVVIKFGDASSDRNTWVWNEPPDITPEAEFLVKHADGEMEPIPEKEHKKK